MFYPMDRKQNYFRKFKNRAEEYLNDKVKLNDLLEKAKEKMEAGKAQLKDAYDTILVFYRLLRAYAIGQYRDIPKKKVLMIIAAFIYLVTPFDAIFDFFPGGLIDDGAIFIWLLSSLKTELDQFREWEKQNHLPDA
jgi:uncharacterized membrane protein YkvA (DUF1232 family)